MTNIAADVLLIYEKPRRIVGSLKTYAHVITTNTRFMLAAADEITEERFLCLVSIEVEGTGTVRSSNLFAQRARHAAAIQNIPLVISNVVFHYLRL